MAPKTAKLPENAFAVLGGSITADKRGREVRDEQDKIRRRERRDKIPLVSLSHSVSPLASSSYLLLGFAIDRRCSPRPSP